MSLLSQIAANTEPGVDYKSYADAAPAPADPAVRLIAFYLPQFHVIPENDFWWGPGFTEWTNVTKALPRFKGHFQPRLPADLGFYDLRNVEVLRRQAALARRFGIGGFCFHHYWFHGRRLLHEPLDLFLANPDINIQFCINWANENWTRRWDGFDKEILVPQAHDPEDDVAFARSLIPAMQDPRYIRIDGRPLLMLYRPGLLPNPIATVRRWRGELARAGLGNPFVVMAQSFGDDDPRLYGMDAAVEFPPHRLAANVPHILSQHDLLDPGYTGHAVDYDEVRRRAIAMPKPPYKLFRGVCPSWDNEARKPGRGFVMVGASPAGYGEWLAAACRSALEAERPDERMVFVNAWNEWAEGAYLEPDRHYGHAYLAETARVLGVLEREQRAVRAAQSSAPVRIALLSHDAHPHGAQYIALNIARALARMPDVAFKILLGGAGQLASAFAEAAETVLVPGDFADPEAWRVAARQLREAGHTAVLSNTTVAAQAIRPLRDAGLRVVQFVHELPSLIRQYGLEGAARDAAELAEVIVFASAYIRDRFVELAGPIAGQTVLLPQGLYIPVLSEDERAARRLRMREALGIRADQPVVLGAAYGDVRKGLDLWPGLIRLVVAACPDAMFVWIGRIEPNLRHWLEHDLAAVGLRERLLLPGHYDDVASVYACADLFALTSREDPFPSVVIEAMAYALPVVVFEGGGGIAATVAEAGGSCVPYLDVDAMAREIVRLLQDRAASAAMGAGLRQTVEREFDFANYADRLLTLAVPGRAASISVVVPNYNYARYLRGRLESIWAQTRRPLEIILLDDASTDDSARVIAELERESPIPIRVVRNAANSGAVARQWARGVELARGELVWIAEADDLAEPDFLATVAAAFADPDLALAYSQSRMIDEHGTVLAETYLDYVADVDPTLWRHDYHRSGTVEIAAALAIKNTIPNASAVVFRRETLRRVLREHLEEMAALRNVADWCCYVRLLQLGSVAFVARSLNNHRRHTASVTISAADRRHLDEIAAMQALAARTVAVSPETATVARHYHAKVAAQFGLDRSGA